jgi:hypothetical protein
LPLLRYTTSMGVIMSVEKIGNVTNILSANTQTRTSVRKQPDPRPEIEHGDVVSIGNSKGVSDIGKIIWPPLFPIGDTQSMFKIEK